MPQPTSCRKPGSLTRRRSWCCSFAVPPSSPENPAARSKKPEALPKPVPGPTSFPASPQSSKSSSINYVVGRIDRILSPGRVSPIPDPTPAPERPATTPRARSEPFRARRQPESERRTAAPSHSSSSRSDPSPAPGGSVFDVRLNLRGNKGGGLVLEMNSAILVENSEVFAGLIGEYRKGFGSKGNDNGNENSNSGNDTGKVCRIEVPEVENLGVFRETIELMFEEDIMKRLVKVGAYRAIAFLEVSASIKFQKGVISCLKYLAAVPWTEEEEEKLRDLVAVFKFDETVRQDIMDRLYLCKSSDSQQNLARELVWSITTCADVNARNELKSLVKGLLCKSSVYEKDQSDLNKEDIYAVCQSCLSSLVSLFEEAFEIKPHGIVTEKERGKPLIERISRQVDNIIWLLEILLDRQMGEEFVDMWADQQELLKLHESASSMVRYEISRVSAMLFIAIGTRKLHCRSDARAGLLQAWFGPMLSDFGWLQRCKKGLDIKALEESMGQTLLTLPLKQQYVLFMEWFRCFSKHGTDCPNLSKAFQIWWRRSFLRGSETHAIESR